MLQQEMFLQDPGQLLSCIGAAALWGLKFFSGMIHGPARLSLWMKRVVWDDIVASLQRPVYNFCGHEPIAAIFQVRSMAGAGIIAWLLIVS